MSVLLYQQKHTVVSIGRTKDVPRLTLDKNTTLDLPFANVRTGSTLSIDLYRGHNDELPAGDYSMFMEGLVVKGPEKCTTISCGGIMFQLGRPLQLSECTAVTLCIEFDNTT